MTNKSLMTETTTPEQIIEMQKQNCLFCQIISGQVSSSKIYEDEQTIAILDINPANPGHLLILPKEHCTIMPQISESVVNHLFKLTKHLSQVLLKTLKAEGTNIYVANGVAAGQQAPHFMIHIIPRKTNDNLNFKQKKAKAKKKTYAELQKAINISFGIKEPINLEEKKENIKAKDEVDLDKLTDILTK